MFALCIVQSAGMNLYHQSISCFCILYKNSTACRKIIFRQAVRLQRKLIIQILFAAFFLFYLPCIRRGTEGIIMNNFKSSRMAEDIKREITAIIRGLKDPRVTAAVITVVRVELTADLSYGKVYISSLDGLDSAKTAVKGLESASGYIKRELGSALRIRKAPELKFIADDSVLKSIEMFAKLNDTQKKDAGEDDSDEN